VANPWRHRNSGNSPIPSPAAVAACRTAGSFTASLGDNKTSARWVPRSKRRRYCGGSVASGVSSSCVRRSSGRAGTARCCKYAGVAHSRAGGAPSRRKVNPPSADDRVRIATSQPSALSGTSIATSKGTSGKLSRKRGTSGVSSTRPYVGSATTRKGPLMGACSLPMTARAASDSSTMRFACGYSRRPA
jgi:hypothetical protein